MNQNYKKAEYFVWLLWPQWLNLYLHVDQCQPQLTSLVLLMEMWTRYYILWYSMTSDFRKVGDFLWFSPLINQSTTI
jgi:hypothetical protein